MSYLDMGNMRKIHTNRPDAVDIFSLVGAHGAGYLRNLVWNVWKQHSDYTLDPEPMRLLL